MTPSTAASPRSWSPTWWAIRDDGGRRGRDAGGSEGAADGILSPSCKAHGGRIVKVMGDGVLVEFASAVNAVRAAVELTGEDGRRRTTASPSRNGSSCGSASISVT